MHSVALVGFRPRYIFPDTLQYVLHSIAQTRRLGFFPLSVPRVFYQLGRLEFILLTKRERSESVLNPCQEFLFLCLVVSKIQCQQIYIHSHYSQNVHSCCLDYEFHQKTRLVSMDFSNSAWYALWCTFLSFLPFYFILLWFFSHNR